MKPSKISDVLDLAYQARKQGLIFNPMLVGDAGLGKSDIIRQWVKKKEIELKDRGGYKFIDLRLAYYEGPDFVGFPAEATDIHGNRRMTHLLPDFWPTEGNGVILLEEPNRGNTMVTNCLMQILTDRAVGPSYVVPDGWMIVGAMNPPESSYDVSPMDTALADRFEMFRIDYDFNTFLYHIEDKKWDEKIVRFIKSGQWVYRTPDSVSKDGKYISPRTWSKLNAAEKAGASDSPRKQSMHRIICQSILGKHIGNEYWKTCWDDAPITAADLINDLKKSLAKLKKQSESGDTYAGDKIAVTVDSIVENYGGWYQGLKNKEGEELKHEEGKIDEATMVAVAKMIPADQAVNLIRQCGYKVSRGNATSYVAEFKKRNPDCIDIMKSSIKIDRAIRRN
jgi:GTPase SAR1 family protein